MSEPMRTASHTPATTATDPTATNPDRSDVVDSDAVASVRAVEEQQLRIVGDGTPRVHVRLRDLLAAAWALVAHVEPLVARNVLAPHQRRSGGGGGAQPGFGPGGGSPSGASAAAIAARVCSALSDGAMSGYDMASYPGQRPTSPSRIITCAFENAPVTSRVDRSSTWRSRPVTCRSAAGSVSTRYAGFGSATRAISIAAITSSSSRSRGIGRLI